MELLLTDRLACPRCGPEFGLILRADRMESRRVHEGVIGCPNCRDAFPVDSGFVDLRPPPRGPVEEWPDADEHSGEELERIVALLGIPRGPGTVALIGGPARFAGEVAAAVEGLQVAAISPAAAAWKDVADVSRLVAGPALPFFSRMLRGVVLDGRLDPALLSEAARVIGSGSRVVVLHAPVGAGHSLEDAGCRVLAEEAGTIVAARS